MSKDIDYDRGMIYTDNYINLMYAILIEASKDMIKYKTGQISQAYKIEGMTYNQLNEFCSGVGKQMYKYINERGVLRAKKKPNTKEYRQY